MQNIQIVEMTEGRAVWKACEAAAAHAEACRQDWLKALNTRGEGLIWGKQVIIAQAAMNFAEAANAAHLARERWDDLVMEQLETERLREKLAELAV